MQMPRAIETAIRQAVSERCVCVLIIPGDIFLPKAVDAPQSYPVALKLPRPAIVPPAEAIDALAALLNKSARVTLLCGAGVAGAHAEVVALARTLWAPATPYWCGARSFPNFIPRRPRGAGRCPFRDHRSARGDWSDPSGTDRWPTRCRTPSVPRPHTRLDR